MKTVTVQVDEQTYPKLIEFLERLPRGHYEVFEDDDYLDEKEQAEISAIRSQLREGDDSEFEDWRKVRKDL